MSRTIGILLVVIGAYLTFKMLITGWLLFLILAIGLSWATASGFIGRWGYSLAALFGLLALPALLFKTLAVAFSILFKLGPIFLVLFGAYLLLKKGSRR